MVDYPVSVYATYVPFASFSDGINIIILEVKLKLPPRTDVTLNGKSEPLS